LFFVQSGYPIILLQTFPKFTTKLTLTGICRIDDKFFFTFIIVFVTKIKSLVLKRKNTDQDIIEGIINNDSKIISLIYKNDFDRIKNMVRGFGNISLQPEDVFQEGLTRAIINVRRRTFKAESSFSTYLYGICRNLCLKDYQCQKPMIKLAEKDVGEETVDDYFDELQMIIRLKERLDEQCRKIIDLRFGLLSNDENSTRFEAVARFLGINADNARQRFRRCFSKLKTMVFQQKELI